MRTNTEPGHEPMKTRLPQRFQEAYKQVAALEQYDRYLGAFVFGSVAQGCTTEESDFDTKIVVDGDENCGSINHPVMAGVKLDISFLSLRQLREETEETARRGERPPFIANSLIVFDKTGALGELRESANQLRPRPLDGPEEQNIQFMLYHSNNKAERNLTTDPATAAYAMNVGLNHALQYHYRIQGHWWLSNKRLLPDLRIWDKPLTEMVAAFLLEANVQAKFTLWSRIIDHILQPLGGRQPIAENNCACAQCSEHLAHFQL